MKTQNDLLIQLIDETINGFHSKTTLEEFEKLGFMKAYLQFDEPQNYKTLLAVVLSFKNFGAEFFNSIEFLRKNDHSEPSKKVVGFIDDANGIHFLLEPAHDKGLNPYPAPIGEGELVSFDSFFEFYENYK